MPEGFSLSDLRIVSFYAFARRRAGGFFAIHLVVLPFAFSFFRQILAADPVKYSFVYVIINRLFADLCFEGQPQPFNLSDNGGGGITFFADFLFDKGG